MSNSALIYLTITLVAIVSGQTQTEPNCKDMPGGGNIDARTCCMLPQIFDPTTTVAKCQGELGQWRFTFNNLFEVNSTCIGECVLKNLKLIDDDGKIKRDELKVLVREKLTSDPEFEVSTVDDVVTSCFRIALDESENMQPEYPTQSNMVIGCIYAELLMKCPTTKFDTTNESCPKLKKFYEDCFKW